MGMHINTLTHTHSQTLLHTYFHTHTCSFTHTLGVMYESVRIEREVKIQVKTSDTFLLEKSLFPFDIMAAQGKSIRMSK